MHTEGEKGGGIDSEIGTDRFPVLNIRWITNKNLLYRTGNSTQYSVITYRGKEFIKKWIHLYI